jgi:signal transduction histidine kinase/CheY-like chemotaxis protein
VIEAPAVRCERTPFAVSFRRRRAAAAGARARTVPALRSGVHDPPAATSGAHACDAFALCSEDGRVVAFDERLFGVFRLSPEERAGVTTLGPTREGRAALEQAVTARCPNAFRCPAGARSTGPEMLPLPDGRVLERSTAPAFGPGGERTHLAFFRDVTAQRRDDAGPGAAAGRDPPRDSGADLARVALADRISATGTLAAGVAHELNNPLAYVTANLAFLSDGMGRVVAILSGAAPRPDDADLAAQLHEAMREARSGAERMRAVVRDLKTFASGEQERNGPVDVRPILDSCVNLAWNEIRSRARLSRDLALVPAVLGNEARLGQLFLNLVVNAAQAIPGGRPDEHEIGISVRMLADGRVAVEVRDTGCGIRASDLPRIFDPFFTTKAPGVGTGLGLSICHAIVASIGGEIQVESTVGVGSTFRVLLAPAARAVAETPASGVPANPPRPRGRILVVDDEPFVGTVLRRTLTDHDVTVVESAHAALARLSGGESYDVVLSDLLMPGMSGMDLYRELAQRDPALAQRFVFLTGGAFTAAAREFLDREKVECVEKPFEIDALRAVLARRMAAAPS